MQKQTPPSAFEICHNMIIVCNQQLSNGNESRRVEVYEVGQTSDIPHRQAHRRYHDPGNPIYPFPIEPRLLFDTSSLEKVNGWKHSGKRSELMFPSYKPYLWFTRTVPLPKRHAAVIAMIPWRTRYPHNPPIIHMMDEFPYAPHVLLNAAITLWNHITPSVSLHCACAPVQASYSFQCSLTLIMSQVLRCVTTPSVGCHGPVEK